MQWCELHRRKIGESGKISRAGLRGIEVDGAVGEVGLDMEGVRLCSWGY